MKAKKAVKKLEKIEALVSDLLDRYTPTEQGVHDALQQAKGFIRRAKDAVNLHIPTGKATNQSRPAARSVVARKAPGKAPALKPTGDVVPATRTGAVGKTG